MVKRLGFFWLLLMSFSGYSQEICNNGIDDDADGLIDLQDPECSCGAGLNAQLNNSIPNADFNSSSCCPATWWNNLNCLDAWTTDTTFFNNSWSVNYMNTCNGCLYWTGTGYIQPSECTTTSNNGFLGMGFWNWNNNIWNYNNRASVCLSAPFYPGNTYVLFFDAFNTWNWNGQLGIDDTIHISLLGTSSCANVPSNSATCNDPNWYSLDSLDIVIPTDTAWHQHSFTFSPTDTVYGIGLGQTCSSYNNNQQWNGWQRILLDNLTLYDSEDYDIQIAESGNICNPPYVLTSSIDTMGGTWQWYKDSVALVGETDSILDITTLGAGNYTAVYSMNGTCQGLNLEVLPPVTPLAFQTPVASPICELDSLYFDDFSFVSDGSIDHFYYDFGNGDSAYTEDPGYVFDTAGVFSVIFTVETDRGCTASATQVVTVYDKPDIDFLTGNQCLYDQADFVNLTTINNGTIDSLAWDFNDGSNIENDSLESHLYSTPGSYYVELFARSDQGCVDSATQLLTIHPVPVADYTVNNDCENISIPFNSTSTISSGTIASYLWRFGDNNTANTPNTSHTYLDPGNLMTTLLVMSDSGCVDSIDVPIEIYPEPVAHFTLANSCFYADFTNTSVIANNGNIVTTNWDFGDANTETDYDVDHFYTADGDYTVTLQVISDYGCVNQHDSTITIFNNFDASFTILNHLVCADDPVKFNNTSTEVFGQEIDYLWETSDGQTSTRENPVFTFTNNSDDPIPVEVSLLISTSSGCIDSAFQTPILSIIPTPNADFYFTPSEPTISNSEVQFTNLSVRADSYDWNFGDDNYSTELNPVHVYADYAKGYTVTLTAYNNSDKICFDRESKILIIEDEILFFIPNTFTPDGSGFNDVFLPQFVSGVDIYNFRLQIFNRWGEIVFESRNPSVGWDGQYAGGLIKQDVYLWQIDFEETMDDKVHTHTGTVNVLR